MKKLTYKQLIQTKESKERAKLRYSDLYSDLTLNN